MIFVAHFSMIPESWISFIRIPDPSRKSIQLAIRNTYAIQTDILVVHATVQMVKEIISLRSFPLEIVLFP